ncbi:MAG: DUF1631 family protein [Burkholderiaceae bacterium]|nr:DUF1631 family protein [Roseateles sp.]MBV8468592.1 DUF1631 family protein [Burkholderiaceae bacterium]
MNAPEIRLHSHLEAALQRIRTAAEQAVVRACEGMGLAALSAGQAHRRDAFLSAQFLFRQRQDKFNLRFTHSLREQLLADLHSRSASADAAPAWQELSLMDDEAVNSLVLSDRIGQAIAHQCEWEIRDVESFVIPLGADGSTGKSQPLRPEQIARAMLEGVQEVSDDTATRQILVDELTRALATEMRSCYADVAEILRSRGLRQQDLRIRTAEAASRAGTPTGQNPALNSSYGGLAAEPHGGAPSTRSVYGGLHGGADAPTTGRGEIGSIDPDLMALLRKIATMPLPASGANPGAGAAANAISAMGTLPEAYGPAETPTNLIRVHREALRQLAPNNLDHMVIDVVGSLFDQILSDTSVPPEMARLLARLQLPVLRTALGDPSFFSSRQHPVRRFVNRLASLACAFDDFTENPGQSFLTRVTELVHQVALGDFDRMALYEQQLDALEQFIQQQTAQALQSQGDAVALVARKEVDRQLQLRYAQQLESALIPVSMPNFLREFLVSAWSCAIVTAARQDGGREQELRLRQFARDLVMSVQSKGPGVQRQAFLALLPQLMRTLNEGLDLIQWPDAQRRALFGELLPAHAESLKGSGLSALDYNMLLKQLEQIFGAELPREQDLAPFSRSKPSELQEKLDTQPAALNPEEVEHLGLVREEAVDWGGELDLDLSDPAPLTEVDISLDGLPAATEAPEPSAGALLVNHLQLGFAYQMHTGQGWQKVRLAHVSAGRSFFIFTQGHKHQETLTMTARMLRKLCEAGRMKAFENAYLLERATARARKQLAALSATATTA